MEHKKKTGEIMVLTEVNILVKSFPYFTQTLMKMAPSYYPSITGANWKTDPPYYSSISAV
jgi:hypothetical protein